MRFKIKKFALVLLVLVCIVISVCIDIAIYRKEKSKILERHGLPGLIKEASTLAIP